MYRIMSPSFDPGREGKRSLTENAERASRKQSTRAATSFYAVIFNVLHKLGLAVLLESPPGGEIVCSGKLQGRVVHMSCLDVAQVAAAGKVEHQLVARRII